MIEKDEKTVIAKFGEPFCKSPRLALNERSCIELYCQQYPTLYRLGVAEFRQYNPSSGVWEFVEHETLKKRLWDFLWDLGESYAESITQGTLVNNNTVDKIIKGIKTLSSNDGCEASNCVFVHVKNGILFFNRKTGRSHFCKRFIPGIFSYSRCNIDFEKDAECPMFLNKLLRPILPSEDCIEILQMYFGQCLLKRNISQTVLLISGEAGIGKSVLVSVIEKVLGEENVAEIHLQNLGEKFELSGYVGRSLLTAKDVSNDSQNSKDVGTLKKMTGKDQLEAEKKYSNSRLRVCGEFNVIVTGNGDLTINYGNSRDAWERRVLWLPCHRPAKFERLTAFDDLLIQNEGKGILAWAVKGLEKLLKNGGKIEKTPTIQRLIDSLLDESDPVHSFVRDCMKMCLDSSTTSEEALAQFRKYVNSRQWSNVNITDRAFYQKFKNEMVMLHPNCHESTNIRTRGNDKCKRGYINCICTQPDALKKCSSKNKSFQK